MMAKVHTAAAVRVRTRGKEHSLPTEESQPSGSNTQSLYLTRKPTGHV